jgi:hypothetical protein
MWLAPPFCYIRTSSDENYITQLFCGENLPSRALTSYLGCAIETKTS